MVEAQQKPLVTITGITGYLGSQVCLYYLKDGSFRVRGTVRSKANATKMDPIKKHFGELFNELEIVEADLLDDASMQKACEGSTYVVHTASPFYFANQTEEELVKPAVQGTTSVVKACKAYGVKRLVITSSVAAQRFGYNMDDPDRPADSIFDESYWTKVDTEGVHAYLKSKTLAEKAAWDFQASLPEAERFEIVTILPSLIIGPVLASGDSTSEAIVKSVVAGQTPEVEKRIFGFVDVRDVALMHLKAIKVPEAANQRFVCSTDELYVREFAAMMSEEFTPKGWPVTTKEKAEGVTHMDRSSHAKAEKVLDFKFSSIKQAGIDMVNSMIENGTLVKPE